MTYRTSRQIRNCPYSTPTPVVQAGLRGRGEATTLEIPTAVRFSFLAFIFTFAFDADTFSFFANLLSVTKILGLGFFAAYFFYYNPVAGNRPWSRPPAAFWGFATYVGIFVIHGFFLDSLDRQYYERLSTLVQLLVFFWLASSLLQDPRLARDSLFAYALGTLLVALAIVSGAAVLSADGSDERSTAMGEDPNTQGTILVLAALMLIGVHFTKLAKFIGSKLLVPISSLPLIGAAVYSGSRTAILAFVGGLMPFFITAVRKMKVGTVAMVCVALLFLGVLTMRNPEYTERWRLALEGNLSRRETIIPEAVAMFLERPIIGWHPVFVWEELGLRTRGKLWKQRDAHNLYLHLLLEVGLVGAIPFFVALMLCGKSAWDARKRRFGYLPLALLLTVLMANLSINWLARKSMWFVLAFAVASTVQMTPRTRNDLANDRHPKYS